MNRAILAICADLHGGHRYGLLSPHTVLEEIDQNGEVVKDYHPPLTKIQDYLWEMYVSQIAAIKKYAGEDDIIVLLDGDLTAGNKYAQMLVSDRLADQFAIGAANVDPWCEIKPKAIRIIKGTGAHVFNQGSSEIVITTLLNAKYPDLSIKVSDHSLLDVAGLTVDVSHHGPPPGSREWLRGNEARYYLRSLMMQEIVAGKAPPRLVVRGHYHDEIEETLIVKSNGNRYKGTLVITPSFTFMDEYARKVCKSPSRITHGMIMVEIVDKEILRIVPLTKTIDIRTHETI